MNLDFVESSKLRKKSTKKSHKQAPEEQPSPLPCLDYWTWDKDDLSREVNLYFNNRIAYFHPNWSSSTAGVRGTRILNNGRYYWELVLYKRIFGTSMMFGIGTKKARLHDDSFVNLLGIDDQSWGLSHKGIIRHNGIGKIYTKPFRENVTTKIGVLFDGFAGTLAYYKDGEYLGVAFRGLHEVKEPLYPIICSTAAKTEIDLIDTRRGYTNLQDICRHVIVKLVKTKTGVMQLLLPEIIESYLCEALENDDTKRNSRHFTLEDLFSKLVQ